MFTKGQMWQSMNDLHSWTESSGCLWWTYGKMTCKCLIIHQTLHNTGTCFIFSSHHKCVEKGRGYRASVSATLGLPTLSRVPQKSHSNFLKVDWSFEWYAVSCTGGPSPIQWWLKWGDGINFQTPWLFKQTPTDHLERGAAGQTTAIWLARAEWEHGWVNLSILLK